MCISVTALMLKVHLVPSHLHWQLDHHVYDALCAGGKVKSF